MRIRATTGAVAASLTLLLLGAASACAAPAITVQNNGAEGPGSLRQAIVDIDPGGTITVPASVGQIGLGGTQLEIGKPMTIVGSGATRPTVDGEGKVRVFRVIANVNVTISGLQIANGKMEAPEVTVAGAGVLVETGNLNLVNCFIVSNTLDSRGGGEHGQSFGAGVAALGSAAVTLTNTTVTDNRAIGGVAAQGGGIYANGQLTINGGAVKGNVVEASAIDGGGIYYPNNAQPGMTLTNLTVSGNLAQPRSGKVANGDGGGIAIHSGTNTLTNVTINQNTIRGDNPTAMNSVVRGGGIAIQEGKTAIVNSTITGNVASANVQNLGFAVGGGALVAGQTSIVNSTIAANTSRGGGTNLTAEGGDLAIFEAGTRVRNSIVAEGAAVSGPNCQFEGAGAVVSEGGNLDSLSQCGFKASGDQSNTSPGLRPLGENGGLVQTMALQTGSLAIGVGRGCPATDARGVLRPASGCDAGAYEVATPIAATGGVTGVGLLAATLNGTATNPDLTPGVVYFEYGTSTAYGTRTADQLIGATASGVGFTSAITGLSVATNYHYREVIRNAVGTVAGPDRTFNTLTLPGPTKASRPHLKVKALGPLRFRLSCSDAALCRVRFTGRAKEGRRQILVLNAKSKVAPGKSKTVKPKLLRSGRRFLKAHGRLPLTLKISLTEPGSKPATVRTFYRTLRP